MQTNKEEKDFNFYFKADLIKLFNAFNQQNTFRFKEFVSIWNEIKFYHILALQRFFPFDYPYFMKDVFKIIVSFLYDEDLDLEVRTASLYTLYAFYCHQLSKYKLKIPVLPSQWISILKFIDVTSKCEHVDVEYIFRFLLHSNAFEFCSSYEIKYNSSHLKTLPAQKNQPKPLEDLTKSERVMSMLEFKKALIEDEVTEQMGMIHEAYLQFKDELFSAVNDPISLNSYINPSFKELICLETFKKITETEQPQTSMKSESVFEKLKREQGEFEGVFSKKKTLKKSSRNHHELEDNETYSKQDETDNFNDDENNESDLDEESEDSNESDNQTKKLENDENLVKTRKKNSGKIKAAKETIIFSDSDQDVLNDDIINKSNKTNSTESDEFEEVE